MDGGSRPEPGMPAPKPDADGLSIVVPIYNEASNLPDLHQRLTKLAQLLNRERQIAVEVVYVDEGSPDNHGDVARWRDEGYDVAYTAKSTRAGESASRRFAVRIFYRLLNWGVKYPIPEDASDFRLLSPRAVAALKQLPERNRFFQGLSSWIGFRQVRVPYEPAKRAHGRSRWNLRALIGLSIEGITAFSTAPLRLASLFGVLLSLTALFFGGWIMFETLYYGESVAGYPSIIVGIMVIGGMQLLMIGIMGEYIAKILSELKGRPAYFVAEHEIRQRQSAGKRGPREAAE